MDTLWFVKSRRAQSNEDVETWIEGGVSPTLNAFDMGDSRATVLIIGFSHTQGIDCQPSEKHWPTLRQNGAGMAVLIIDGTRVGDVRIYDDEIMQTVIQRWGTGGGNVPYVFPIQDQATRFSGKRGDKQDGKGNGLGIGRDGEPMNTLTQGDRHAIAYDEYNDSIADTHHVLRAGTKQSTGVIQSSVVRRLTPIECERLQGFPDNWTADQADSHRYKQMGNAVTVNVIAWIGARL